MTEDEKRQQKAMLLLEFQEAEHELANLRERAGRVAQPILDVGKWIMNASPELGPSVNKVEFSKYDTRIRVNADRYRKAVNFDDALALMDEIATAEKKLENLAMRKTELGLK